MKMKKTEKKNPPAEAGKCSDKNCPVHGGLRTRGRIFRGRIIKVLEKERKITIEIEKVRYDKKYERYFRKKMRIHAHLPPCTKAEVGKNARIMECRPISKTKHSVLVEVEKE